jgi:hypothetical protein
MLEFELSLKSLEARERHIYGLWTVNTWVGVRVGGPQSVLEAIISTYPVVKDVLGKLGARKLKAQDLMLLATVHNMQVLTDKARVLSNIECSIRGVNDELRKLDEHLKPVLEAAAELLKAEAERRRGKA